MGEPKHVQDPATIHLLQVVDLIAMVTLNSQHIAMKEAVPELQVVLTSTHTAVQKITNTNVTKVG